MARELHDIALLQTQRLFEPLSNLHQRLFALLRAAALATRDIAITTAGEGLANALGPQADAVETLAHVDHDAHDFAVVFVLESLADGRKHHVKPEVVDGDGLLVLELEGPFAAVLVLDVFPFGFDAVFKEVVVGLEGELGGGTNVILLVRVSNVNQGRGIHGVNLRRYPRIPRPSRRR